MVLCIIVNLNNNQMKNKTIKSILLLFTLVILFSACSSKYDGLILTDENTGKKYLLRHNLGDNYFIDEQTLYISGKDTTLVFK